MRKMLIAGAAAAAVLATTTTVSAREDSGKRFTVMLTGEAEAPGPGDPDGMGQATVRVNPGQGQICYTIQVSGIAPAAAAHIHEAPAGTPGPVVFHLNAPTSGMSQGCVTVTRDEAMEVLRNPEEYYINVHNADFPNGALRGQLGM